MLMEKPWKPDLVLRLMMGIFASICIGVLVVSGYTSLQKEGTVPTLQVDVLNLIVGTFTLHGVGLVLVGVFLRQHGVTWSEAFGFQSPGLGKTIFFAFVVGMIALPMALSLAELSSRLLTWVSIPVEPQQAVKSLQNANAPWQKIYHGFVGIIVAPFVEEVIFRGIIYPTLKTASNKTLALWGTSLLFAFIHNNLGTFIPLTFLAVILTLLYETTNNLLAPILTHSFFNAVNFIMLIYRT
ncbi:MAG: CPBP family intramembrane glutamic endopeptidase [Verrucomicrobiales bacterium]